MLSTLCRQHESTRAGFCLRGCFFVRSEGQRDILPPDLFPVEDRQQLPGADRLLLREQSAEEGQPPHQLLRSQLLPQELRAPAAQTLGELAAAVREQGGVSQKWTCSALQLHNAAIIACDEAACGELTVDTYKYFLDIEKKERR